MSRVASVCVSCGASVDDPDMARCARCEEGAPRRARGVDARGRLLRRCANGHTLIGQNSARTAEGERYCRRCGAGEAP